MREGQCIAHCTDVEQKPQFQSACPVSPTACILQQAYTPEYLQQQRRDKTLASHRRTKQQAFWLSLGLALGSGAYRWVVYRRLWMIHAVVSQACNARG